MDNTNNKDYWEKYVSYWESRTADANSGKAIMDRTANDRLLQEHFLRLYNMGEQKAGRILDFGCGSGRLYPLFCNQSKATDDAYYGVDISKTCLEHMEKMYPELKINRDIFETDGRTIPFADETFDKCVCFGVFDACNQEEILGELLRVVKVGGYILLTGKKDNYYEDDIAALVAERNARRKNHPNHFTVVEEMIQQVSKQGVGVEDAYYFLRRGDFVENVAIGGGGGEIPSVF